MSEIKVGEYIRTKQGHIAKVIMVGHLLIHLDRTIDFKEDTENFYSGINCIDIEDFEEIVVKNSPNIISLIEVGDYVNGKKVIGILNDERYCPRLVKCLNDNVFLNEDIKSIVTKERFQESEYKV